MQVLDNGASVKVGAWSFRLSENGLVLASEAKATIEAESKKMNCFPSTPELQMASNYGVAIVMLADVVEEVIGLRAVVKSLNGVLNDLTKGEGR